jgi:hypothetical protein
MGPKMYLSKQALGTSQEGSEVELGDPAGKWKWGRAMATLSIQGPRKVAVPAGGGQNAALEYPATGPALEYSLQTPRTRTTEPTRKLPRPSSGFRPLSVGPQTPLSLLNGTAGQKQTPSFPDHQ